jgi:hypothetical protein
VIVKTGSSGDNSIAQSRGEGGAPSSDWIIFMLCPKRIER